MQLRPREPSCYNELGMMTLSWRSKLRFLSADDAIMMNWSVVFCLWWRHHSVMFRHLPTETILPLLMKSLLRHVSSSGLVLRHLERFDESISRFTEAIALRSDNYIYFNNRAHVYFEKRMYVILEEERRLWKQKRGKSRRRRNAKRRRSWTD